MVDKARKTRSIGFSCGINVSLINSGLLLTKCFIIFNVLDIGIFEYRNLTLNEIIILSPSVVTYLIYLESNAEFLML